MHVSRVAAWPSSGLEIVSNCPVCSSGERTEELASLEDRIFGVSPGQWTLFRCRVCRCAYLDPRPDVATIGLAYQNYYTHSDTRHEAKPTGSARLRTLLSNSYTNRLFGTRLRPSLPGVWIIAAFAPHIVADVRLYARGLDKVHTVKGKLLDIGCGNGSFLGFAQHLGWTGFGVEPDPEAAKFAQGRGITILGDRVGDLCGRFDNYFDVVTLSHVIEHVHDPLSCVGDCLQLLKPGGYLWIETPNIDSTGYEIYSRYWRGLEPPRHLALFNPPALKMLLRNAGFAGVEILPPRDPVAQLFLLSASSAAGYIAEIEPASFTESQRSQLDANVRRAEREVRRRPGKSEVIRAQAYKSSK